MPGIKQRPNAATGKTYRVSTPMGTAYITINRDSTEDPIEVFTNVGKAGSDTAAVSEALGRLISLCLRLPSPMGAASRIEHIAEQLSGIGGSRHTGFGKNRVKSLPDAIARVLLEDSGQAEPENVVKMQVKEPKIGDLCPECGQASLVFEEGCQKCYSCGFSEC